MKKILYTASRISHINNFHLPYLKYFHEAGYQIHIIADGKENVLYADTIYPLPFAKKINSFQNIKTIFFISKILKKEDYDLIISNSTLAGFLTRTALMISGNKKSKCIHISHGYLFSNNTPIIKKAVYLAAEKICVPVTDTLLTMNQEDYKLAQKYKLCKHNITNIPGMGISIPKTNYKNNMNVIRKQYGLKKEDIVIIYPAEFSKRKNQLFLIENFIQIFSAFPNVKLLLAGDGEMLPICKETIKMQNLEKYIFTPGYIKDILPLLSVCDLAISSSKSEGLPFNIMEAMSFGLPIIASNVKGHVDLIEENMNGFLFKLTSKEELFRATKKAIQTLYRFRQTNNNIPIPKNISSLSENNIPKIEQYFTIDAVFEKNRKILETLISDE